MTENNGEWAKLKSNFPGNALYRGKILKIISLAYEKYLERGGDDASLKHYDVVVEINESGETVEILFSLRNLVEPIDPTADLIEIFGFTFNFEDCGLVDVATVR
ncbi:hypothetical protein [Pseudoduganella sp. R-43]|uniref:hypothetical protein n=1 Tax=Pseudoduganella sp. R-43 TaxID=3404063 RepID=UPI003CF50AAE